MSYTIIEQRKIRKLRLPNNFDLAKIQIGVPVDSDEAYKVNLIFPGDAIIPSASFGSLCHRNAYGYMYSDKTKSKKRRYVNTIMIHPYGNENASPVSCDIYRRCYPQISVPPTEIEFCLFEAENKKMYVIANLTENVRERYLIEVVNLFLEIYGRCYIFSDEISVSKMNIKRRCNWEILPPGEKPSVHLMKHFQTHAEEVNLFDVERLKTLEKYSNIEQTVEGVNGFKGYFAFVFPSFCVLESAIYGNATYIIPKENWEILSQKTKRELMDDSFVIEKIVHTKNWKAKIRQAIRLLENMQ